MLNKITTKIKFWLDSLINIFRNQKIVIIIETGNWVIQNISLNLTSLIKNTTQSTSTLLLQNKIIHFSSIHSYISQRQKIHPSNKVIITWYHLNERLIEKEIARQISQKENITIHTACQKTKSNLIAAGVPAEKIIIIPLGIDLKNFKPSKNPLEKTEIKKRLDLPLDKIIIGSFQKDGNGWGEGNEPKLIKGPDIFCDTVEILAKKFPIHILLTGPARGYVKNRLSEAGIPFTHKYLKKYNDIVNFYHALDLYIISSRVEGGPMALLESWATGVSLVSTPVGMVKDIGKNEENILLADIGDVKKLARQATKLIENQELSKKLSRNALEEVQKYTWQKMADNCLQKLYS